MDRQMQTGSARPRSTLYLESRYRKLRRGLPQTIFYCPKCKGDRRRRRGCEACEGFGKLTKDSVQELIGRRVIPQMQAKDLFSAFARFLERRASSRERAARDQQVTPALR